MLAALQSALPTLAGTSIAGSQVISADDFSYTDPVDGSVSTHQGLRLRLADGARIVCRLSGTGTEGATLRLYVERYHPHGGQEPVEAVLTPLVHAAVRLLGLRERCGRDRATVIT
jgi:phosphoglucomutase